MTTMSYVSLSLTYRFFSVNIDGKQRQGFAKVFPHRLWREGEGRIREGTLRSVRDCIPAPCFSMTFEKPCGGVLLLSSIEQIPVVLYVRWMLSEFVREICMTLQLIHVGLGGWGSSWAEQVVAQNKDVETTAWVEIDTLALKAARQRLGLPEERCFTSLEAALKAVPAAAVLVTASLPGHVPSARTALEAGKHVLMEKPFAPSMQEAKDLVELAAAQQRTLMISQNYRYMPAARAAAQLIEQQAIGRLDTIALDFREYDNVAPFESYRHYSIWEPLLVDMSIHHFDLLRMVLRQEPVQVYCQTWNSPWSKYVEPAAGTMTITFDGGTVVSYRGSWFSTGPRTSWSGEWRMEGELGEITWAGRGETPDAVTLRLLGEEKPQSVKLPVMPLIDRQGSLAAFVQAVQSNTEPETNGRDNLKTLALMYAAIESAKLGRPVDVQDL